MKNLNKYSRNLGLYGVLDARLQKSYNYQGRSCVIFNNSGTRMYWIYGRAADTWIEYDLGIPWDFNTVLKSKEYTFPNPQHFDVYSARFSTDGTKLFIHEGTRAAGNVIFSYILTEAWEPTTAVYETAIGPTLSDGSYTSSFFLDDTGTRMWIYSWSNQFVAEAELTTPWDLTTYNKIKDIDTLPIHGVFSEGSETLAFSPDGRYLYHFYSNPINFISQFECTTPWDIETAQFVEFGLRADFDWDGNWASGQITFTPNGKYLIYGDSTREQIVLRRMDIPWDIGTANIPHDNRIMCPGQTGGFDISPDGKDLVFHDGYWGAPVHWRMRNAHVLSTAKDMAKQFRGPYEDQDPLNPGTWKYQSFEALIPGWNDQNGFQLLSLSDDGRYLFTCGTSDFPTPSTYRRIYRFTLDTPYATESLSPNQQPQYYQLEDISDDEAIASGGTYGFSSNNIFTTKFSFHNGGRRLHINHGSSYRNSYRIDLDEPWNLESANTNTKRVLEHMMWKTFGAFWNDMIDFQFTPDGNEVILYDLDSQQFKKYSLNTPWDIGDVNTHIQSSYEFTKYHYYDTVRSFKFTPDGKHLYYHSYESVVGGTGIIQHLVLDVPWDLSTIRDSNPRIRQSSQMLKTLTGSAIRQTMYTSDGEWIVGINNTGGRVLFEQIKLDVPYDVSSVNLSNTKMTSMKHNQLTGPSGFSISGAQTFVFGDHGRKLYALDGTSDRIFQYDLKIPWDFRSGTRKWADKSFSLSTIESNSPTGLDISPDGKRLFVVSKTSRFIRQVTLNEAWNIATTNTATLKSSPQLPTTFSTNIYFVNNGYNIMVDYLADEIYLIKLTEAWNVQTIQANTSQVPANTEGWSFRGLSIDYGSIDFSPDATWMIVHPSTSLVNTPTVSTKRIFGNDFKPSQDVEKGNWKDKSGSNVNLYSILTDYSRDSYNSNTIMSSLISPSSSSNTDILRIKIANTFGYKIANTKYNNVIKYRLRCNSIDQTRGNLSVSLYQGNTIVEKWNDTKIIPSRNFYYLEQTISPDKYTMITDGDDLYLEFRILSSLDQANTSIFNDSDIFGTAILAGPLIATEFDETSDFFGTHTINIV